MSNLFGFYPIFWREIVYRRKRLWKVLAGNLINPLLFLTTFGLGLGRRMSVGEESYLNFVLPGIIALASLSNSYNAIGVDLNIRRTIYKAFDQYILAPIRPSSIVFGEVLVGALQGAVSCFILLALGLLFGVHIKLTLLFFVVLFTSCITFASLGVIAAMIADSHADMTSFGAFVILPMTFLGGTFFPIDFAPAIVKVIVWMMPLTPVSFSLRSIALNGRAPIYCLMEVFVWAVIMYTMAIVAVTKKSAD